jgi:hypothetical protein
LDHGIWTGIGRKHISRFLIVFHHPDGERSEMRDSTDGEPHVKGVVLHDGAVLELKGVTWLATREDVQDDNDIVRFVCTLVSPVDS